MPDHGKRDAVPDAVIVAAVAVVVVRKLLVVLGARRCDVCHALEPHPVLTLPC